MKMKNEYEKNIFKKRKSMIKKKIYWYIIKRIIIKLGINWKNKDFIKVYFVI
jgi:hypothetical protein